MKCVVLGSSGFVGRACVEELLKRGDTVTGFDKGRKKPKPEDDTKTDDKLTFLEGNILDREMLTAAFEGADEIYLLAGQLGTSELESAMRMAIETNILGALTVFETALACKVPRVFLASKPSVWLNTYTITKHTAEKIANLLSRYHPVEISVLRYLNIYGPGQKIYPVRKVLPTFAVQAMRGLPLHVYGEGNQTVDMLYVKDAAYITVEVMRNKFNPDAMDCGTGTEMTVLEVAESVNKYFNNSAGIKHMPMRIGETHNTRLVADNTDLIKTIGEINFTPYDEGLAESLAYYEHLNPHDIDAALNFYGFSQPFSMAWK
ncbi:NAD-dependent epimerase/dehydratase family protein [Mucilaginibacter phyllosphaerae]|uniref:NAD-dependent epimerase/dehydratase family protein n=1 Tax=Mucilaginibacter phyllosphaerae TaxID=1812349 RepID=A0A4Y8A9E1_9SPHI|nr:NAD-dependent epimerase/dehydratase family protein [Mucilaginibacter phyllosphaerae]MBB3969670.1 nucleoside-diphosphate-sugar epimerase [Mucilaginibacter phyllosphaerae]TEW65054.1 NAD-dependent epimerase/dehydratase family protein [Mucilaginibacter phyllosphaerae]GGH18268.1 UDP-glucose 4-epimerase [Mucilaginibacter phyllosphaerae]